MAYNVKRRGKEPRPRPRESPALSMDEKGRATEHGNVHPPQSAKFSPTASRRVSGRFARSRCSTKGDAPPSPPEPTPFGDGGTEGGADPQQRTPRGGHRRRDQRRGRLVFTPFAARGSYPTPAAKQPKTETPQNNRRLLFWGVFHTLPFFTSRMIWYFFLHSGQVTSYKPSAPAINENIWARQIGQGIFAKF